MKPSAASPSRTILRGLVVTNEQDSVVPASVHICRSSDLGKKATSRFVQDMREEGVVIGNQIPAHLA